MGEKKVIQLWHAYQAEDADGRREIETVIRFQLQKHLGVGPLTPGKWLFLPQCDEAAGEYVLGTVSGGRKQLYPFGLREDEFIQHMAIFGRSGAGKTNTVALLVKELVKHRKPFLIFDWKRNYRDLLAGSDPVPLEVYTVGLPVHPLRFNPLIPPAGTPPKVWLKKLIEIISNAYYLGEGVMFLLQEAIDAVYRDSGCYNSTPPEAYPTMQDVLGQVQGMPAKGRRAMWLDSTMRAVQSLCFGQISDVINVSHSDSIHKLLDKNVCLELNALGHAEKIFLMETLLVWIHHYRMTEPDRETFKHCLIVEEAHNILGVSKKETVIDLLLREIRELGEGIVLVDQHPSQISVPAIGNTYCTIALNMKHTKDINALADIMHVPKEERHIFGELPMGAALVKLQSRYTQAFQIRIPEVKLIKGGITDTHLAQIYPGDYTDSASTEPASPDSTTTEAIPPVCKKDKPSAEPVIPETAQRLLKDIVTHPYDGVVKRYSRLGISRRRGNTAKEQLLNRKLIKPVDIPTRTGKVVLLAPSEALKTALRKQGKLKGSDREGGIVHSYWKQQLATQLESHGWTVTQEKTLTGGIAIDLEARKGKMAVAIEVETGRRGAGNIEKLSGRKYAWIVSFATYDSVRSQTKNTARKRGINTSRVLFVVPGDYEKKIAMLSKWAESEPQAPPKP